MEGQTAPLDALSDMRMVRRQRIVITALCEAYPRAVSSEVLVDRLYGDDPSGGPEDALAAVGSVINKLRKRLPSYGWTIPNAAKGTGDKGRYRLEPAHKGEN